jgi:hypothetical protein
LKSLDDALACELNAQFVQQFGPILSSEVLVKVLGYRSPAAYRQAVARDTVPVPLFQIPNRRGRFALARDVAIWMSQQRRAVTTGDRARHLVPAESNKSLLEHKERLFKPTEEGAP